MFLMGPAITVCTVGPVVCFALFLRLKPPVAAVMMMNTQLAMRIVQSVIHTVLVEGFMVSAQRLIQFAEMPLEPAMASTRTTRRRTTARPLAGAFDLMPNAWKPSAGALVLRSVSMRYAPTLPLVLNDVNLKVESGEKVGTAFAFYLRILP